MSRTDGLYRRGEVWWMSYVTPDGGGGATAFGAGARGD